MKASTTSFRWDTLAPSSWIRVRVRVSSWMANANSSLPLAESEGSLGVPIHLFIQQIVIVLGTDRSHLHCPHSPSSDMSRHECLLHAGGAPGSGAAMLQEVSWSPWRWGVRAHTQVPEREPGVRGWEPAVGLITRLGEDWWKAPLPEVTFEPKDGLGLESMQRHDYHAGLDDGSQAGL